MAILLAEAVVARAGDHPGAARVLADAHQRLLDAGGAGNFWESGWLESQGRRWAERSVPPRPAPDERPRP